MARINNLTNFLNDVATAIKQKLGDNTPIPASQFDTKIGEIETGGNYQTKSISITTNGNYTQLPDTGFDAMDQVVISVNVPTEEPLEPTTAIPDDVLSPKTFYSNGQKLTGRITGHRTPLGETLDINSSFIDTISNYDTCINNQNIVCKYNSSGYVTFYKADTDNQTLTLLYTTDLSGVYFTMSDCYYGSTNNEFDILLVTKNKSNDTTKGQTFNTYILKVRDTITFEALTEKDLVISDYYYGRLYSTMSNGIWYVFLAYSSYNTSSMSEAYCSYQIYQADYSFNGTLNYIKKSNSNIYTGRIATNYCYLTGMNISTLENGTHLVTASSRSSNGYSNLMRAATSVFSSDFSTKLYSSGYNDFWPSSGNAYYGGICTIGKYIVSMYTSDSSSNVYTVRVHEFASNTLTLKSTQTITIPTDLIGGAPNSPAMFHVLGSYGICLFKRNLYYGFVFTVNNSGGFVIGENLMNGGSEYETFAVRNQNSNSLLDLKTWSIRVNSNGQRLDNLNVGNKTLYNTDDANVSAENILNSKIAYTNEGRVAGSMPNNGQLSYTPSTSQQTIPAGYTTGGTIGAVTSAIDQNIQAENIKKDVEILGVTGTLEPDDPEYDTNLALSYQILGIEPYMIEVEKITSQIDDIDYPSSSYGSISLTPMKLEMHPQLNIPVTTEDATDIANLFNNGTSLTIELHNAHGAGSQLLIADGGITFDCGGMAHISYEWKENPWGGTPGQMLATPVWSAEQAWDILDVESKSPLTQEDLDKVITAFNDGWYPINEGYLRLQWSYRSGYTLTSVDKQNINSLLTYLFKYLGITLTDTSLT